MSILLLYFIYVRFRQGHAPFHVTEVERSRSCGLPKLDPIAICVLRECLRRDGGQQRKAGNELREFHLASPGGLVPALKERLKERKTNGRSKKSSGSGYRATSPEQAYRMIIFDPSTVYATMQTRWTRRLHS